MTVRELIEKLQAEDPDVIVCYTNDGEPVEVGGLHVQSYFYSEYDTKHPYMWSDGVKDHAEDLRSHLIGKGRPCSEIKKAVMLWWE